MFHDLEYKELEARSRALNGKFCDVRTAQDLYNIQKSESNGGQSFSCSPQILRVTYLGPKESSNFDMERPQVNIPIVLKVVLNDLTA